MDLLSQHSESILSKRKVHSTLLMDALFDSEVVLAGLLQCYLFKILLFLETDQSQLNYQGTNMELKEFQMDNSCIQAGQLVNAILANRHVIDTYPQTHPLALQYLGLMCKTMIQLFQTENQMSE